MDAELRRRRFWQAGGWAVGTVFGIVALVAWAQTTEPAWGARLLSYADFEAYEGAIRAAAIPAGVVGITASTLAAFLWDRIVLVRRFGDRHVPRQPRDGWGWLVFWPCFVLVINVGQPFDVMPAAYLGEFGWYVLPSAFAWWMIVVLALCMPVPFIAWRAIRDQLDRGPVERALGAPGEPSGP